MTAKEILDAYISWSWAHTYEHFNTKDAFVAGAFYGYEQHNKWISTEDRFPDDKRNVMIITEGNQVYIAYYLADAECWQSPYRDEEYKHVTHWREIPLSPDDFD